MFAFLRLYPNSVFKSQNKVQNVSRTINIPMPGKRPAAGPGRVLLRPGDRAGSLLAAAGPDPPRELGYPSPGTRRGLDARPGRAPGGGASRPPAAEPSRLPRGGPQAGGTSPPSPGDRTRLLGPRLAPSSPAAACGPAGWPHRALPGRRER